MTSEQLKHCSAIATEELDQACLRAFARMREQAKVQPAEERQAARIFAETVTVLALALMDAITSLTTQHVPVDAASAREMAEMQALYRQGEMG